jgi:pimeloyl-ACP methyl ester carboxylesterase
MNKNLTFDASRLAVAVCGTGEPAVFVHGLGSNKSVWRNVSRGLADIFRSYAIDLPGCGESPAPRRFRYTLEHYADVLTDFIIMKDLRKLTLVGASLGAAVILLALLRRSDKLNSRVRSLCLIDAMAYPQDLPFFVEALRTPFWGGLALSLPAIFLPPQYARYYARREVRQALIETACLINPKHFVRYAPRLKTIRLPTLVIWGRKDGIVPLRFGKRLARDLPNSRLVVVDRCGHSPHDECPAEVIVALKEFAQEISGDVLPIGGPNQDA